MTEQEYIPVEEVAHLLGVKTRQAHRYAEGPQARIRTKHAGPHNRKLFHKGDVEALATERRTTPATVQRPKAELVPISEMLTYIRERDQHVEELQRQLRETAAQVGYLRSQLEQRLLPQDSEALQQKVVELEAKLAQAQQPWWKKFLRRKLSSNK